MTAKVHEAILVDIAMSCVTAIVEGRATITISATGKSLKGFPRGELLSVGTNGSRNIAVDPVKVLAWIHKGTMAREASRRATSKGGAE